MSGLLPEPTATRRSWKSPVGLFVVTLVPIELLPVAPTLRQLPLVSNTLICSRVDEATYTRFGVSAVSMSTPYGLVTSVQPEAAPHDVMNVPVGLYLSTALPR